MGHVIEGSAPDSETFIGGWAEDTEECGSGRDHRAPIVISSRSAKTTGEECDFRSIKREAAGRWRVEAVCTSDWSANIDLQLSAPNLIALLRSACSREDLSTAGGKRSPGITTHSPKRTLIAPQIEAKD